MRVLKWQNSFMMTDNDSCSVPAEDYDGIKVVGICSLMKHLYGDTAFRGWDPAVDRSYEQESADVVKWCLENGAHYYAADREDFSKWKAASIARARGMIAVVVEDLS